MRYALERNYDKHFILDRKQGERKEIDAKLAAEIEARHPTKEFDSLPKDEKKSDKKHDDKKVDEKKPEVKSEKSEK